MGTLKGAAGGAWNAVGKALGAVEKVGEAAGEMNQTYTNVTGLFSPGEGRRSQ
jgi:hypothetical protein